MSFAGRLAHEFGLDDDHDCAGEGCYPPGHYSSSGLCAVCHGCGDPECCTHDDECFVDARFEAGVAVA